MVTQLLHILPWILLAVIAFISLFFINAPYGRFIQQETKFLMNSKYAWLVMEAPAPLIIALFFLININVLNITQLLLYLIWQSHYLHRTFIYPFTLRHSNRPFPVVIVIFGFLFNIVNAYLNGNSVIVNASQYSIGWLTDIRFVVGVFLFFAGYIINRHSDYLLYKMKKQQNNGYNRPDGGLFRWVSCPNYLGEIIIWTGWAIGTWSPAGLAFAFWTIANLAPRAFAYHRWYQQQFTDYPANRRALIPCIW